MMSVEVLLDFLITNDDVLDDPKRANEQLIRWFSSNKNYQFFDGNGDSKTKLLNSINFDGLREYLSGSL